MENDTKKLVISSFISECSRNLLMRNQDAFKNHHLLMIYIIAFLFSCISFIFSHSNISIIIFLPLTPLCRNFFPTSYLVSENEIGHTASGSRLAVAPP